MARVLVPLADGCEELEAVTIIDLLRRAEIEVVTAGLRPGPLKASRGVVIVPDRDLDGVNAADFDMIALPGGAAGAEALAGDERVLALLREMAAAGKYIAAICAAPKVLAAAELLQGRRATSFPGWLDGVAAVDYREEPVVVDDKLITSRGPGTAMDFALTLIETLAGQARRDEVDSKLQRC